MTDSLILSRDDEGHFIVVHEGQAYRSVSELLTGGPAIGQPDRLADLCMAINHFARGYQYRLIREPREYQTRFNEQRTAHESTEPWEETTIRPSDFGEFDLAALREPSMDSHLIHFFVEDTYLGIPYRASLPSPGTAIDQIRYEPLLAPAS